MTQSRHNTAWSRDELILALYLYCQIPFAKTKANNPEVIQLAQLLGRTPSSVARKLGNFGAFDPLLAQKGIRGLTHFSKADRDIWNTYYQHWDLLVNDSQHMLEQRNAQEVSSVQYDVPIISSPSRLTETESTVMVRLGQSFFRRTVLSSYENSCCICELDIPLLLIASHIVPWSASHEHRLDPENGLCLCALHDKAFDKGLISVTKELQISVAEGISTSRSEFSKIILQNFSGKKIRLPHRFAPKAQFLDWHYTNIFLG